MQNKFNFQPNLEGDLVAIRPLVENDRDALWKLSSDSLIWEQLPRCERYKKEVFEKFFEESISLKTTVVIIENQSDQVIGSSRYARFNQLKSEVEIGWTFLTRKFWGKGYNADSKRLMIENAFNFVDSVFFVAATTNYRSRKAIEKLGAKLERELDWLPNAQIQDKSVLYRVHKRDWLPR